MFVISLWVIVFTILVIGFCFVITNYLNNKDNDYQEMKQHELFKSKFDKK